MEKWLQANVLAQVTEWLQNELIPSLMVYSVAIIGAAMMLCFLLQMLTGNIKWAKRAALVLVVGTLALGFIFV